MLISIPCHIFCSGKRLPIPAARPYLSVYSKWPPRVFNITTSRFERCPDIKMIWRDWKPASLMAVISAVLHVQCVGFNIF